MTPKSFTTLIFGVLMVSCLVQATKEDGCPKIKVKKNSILRTAYSRKAGAKFLSRQVVHEAKECYRLCCGRSNCNLALLQYKNDSDGGIERTCYQFDCGNPSKCSFAPFPHYATIIFQPRHEDLVGGREDIDDHIPTTARPATKSLAQELDCPPSAPVAMCLKNPCKTTVCPAYPSATCKPSYCGGCFAHFFDDLGERVSCEVVKPHVPIKSKEEEDLELANKLVQSYHHSEQKPVRPSDAFKDELRKMQNLLNSKHHSNDLSHKLHNTYDVDDIPSNTKSKSQHQSEKVSIEKKLEEISPHKEKPEEEEDLDHEQRVWPDNNPNYPDLPHKKTEAPLDHDQRQWPDNNPNFVNKPKPTTVKVTPKPTTKMMTKPTPKPKTKPTTKMAPKVAPKTVPKPTPRPTPEPVVVIDKAKDDRKIETPRRMNVTMVIEDNRVHFVENKAVLPLAIFLVIAILLLFVVALRLRIIKSKLKRRPFATEDADYLINGMYL